MRISGCLRWRPCTKRGRVNDMEAISSMAILAMAWIVPAVLLDKFDPRLGVVWGAGFWPVLMAIALAVRSLDSAATRGGGYAP